MSGENISDVLIALLFGAFAVICLMVLSEDKCAKLADVSESATVACYQSRK